MCSGRCWLAESGLGAHAPESPFLASKFGAGCSPDPISVRKPLHVTASQGNLPPGLHCTPAGEPMRRLHTSNMLSLWAAGSSLLLPSSVKLFLDRHCGTHMNRFGEGS